MQSPQKFTSENLKDLVILLNQLALLQDGNPNPEWKVMIEDAIGSVLRNKTI